MKTVLSIISHKQYFAILLAVFVVISGLRILFINADAPQDLSISAAIFTDEGFKTFAARNFNLFGDWRWTPVDEYGNWFSQSPLGTMSYVFVFDIFGISFATIRGLSIIYSIATAILFYAFMIRTYDRETAFIGLLLFGSNFFNVMSGRLGFFETHLNFFVMVSIIAITEMIRNIRGRRIISYIVFGIVSVIGIVAQFYLKRNFLIIPLAMAPALIIHICRKIGFSALVLRRILFTILISAVIFYLLFAHLSMIQNAISELMLINLFGHPIGYYLPLRLFDTIPSMLGKGLYLEFIFLHPVTFALGVFYSIYIFYSFIQNRNIPITDLYCASWLLFGFIILTLLSYHPSRYYQLFTIPLIVCVTRSIREMGSEDMIGFFRMNKPLPFNLMTLLLYIAMTFYACVVLLVQIIPFQFRSNIMRILYPAFVNGQIGAVLHIIIPVILFSLMLMTVIIIKRESLRNFFISSNRAGLIFFLILVLQLFQYGRWAVTRDYTLYETSRDLGMEIPENSILIGSWSSGLSIENKLRPLIIQAGNSYNYSVIESLLRDDSIAVNRKIGDRTTVYQEKGAPIYFAVSRNVIFERPIVKQYGSLFTKNNFFKSVTMGYFDVEIYKLR